MINLEGLTNAELSALRAALIPRARDARKKAIAAIFAEEDAKKAWNKWMTPAKEEDPEQKLVLRKAAQEEFEALLAKHPDAFCKQLHANLLLEMEGHIQKEMLRRSELKPKKGTK